MKTEKLLKKLIDHYGPEAQRFVFIGKLGELNEAVNSGSRRAIIEELADVTIMLAQRFLIGGIGDINGVESPTIDSLKAITNQIMVYEGRLTQGRKYSYLPLYALSGWLKMKTIKMRAENEVSEMVTLKLRRQLTRIEGSA